MHTGQISLIENTHGISIVQCGAFSECKLFQSLTPFEMSVYECLPTRKKRNWLLGRKAGKMAVKNYFSEGPILNDADVEIVSGDGMPPRFIIRQGQTDISTHCALSLSHSHGVAIACVVDRCMHHSLGVDVELIRTFDTRTAQAFLTDDEYILCSRLEAGARDHAVTLRWCMKEAYLKAIGTGLRMHPRTVAIPEFLPPYGQAIFTVSGQRVPVQVSWTTFAGLYIIVRIIL